MNPNWKFWYETVPSGNPAKVLTFSLHGNLITRCEFCIGLKRLKRSYAQKSFFLIFKTAQQDGCIHFMHRE
jgi:hypothetical protein